MFHQLRLAGVGFTSNRHGGGVLIARAGKQTLGHGNHSVARGRFSTDIAQGRGRHNDPRVFRDSTEPGSSTTFLNATAPAAACKPDLKAGYWLLGATA